MGKKSRQKRQKAQYPMATVIYYGPDDRTATKVAVGIICGPGEEAAMVRRWHGIGVERDVAIQTQIAEFVEQQGAKSVLVNEGILGCPHEEGMDYPEGTECLYCSFWRGKPRDLGRVTLLTQLGGRKKSGKASASFAVATYNREQWQRLREVATDRETLEATWEEWQAVKDQQVARLRSSGFQVHEVAVDVDGLEEYCRQRGVANDSAARAEYAVYRMQRQSGGDQLEV